MENIREFVDERNKSWCIHCGAWIKEAETSRDHVPSKCLLRERYPANLPIVEICTTCNSGFSTDEEYLSVFLNCVLAGSTEPDRQLHPKIGRTLERHKKLRATIERSKMESQLNNGNTRRVWKPETDRINRIIIKNARGHAYYEYGEPMLTAPEHVWAVPLELMTMAQREKFNSIRTDGRYPEVCSRMLTRVLTEQDLCYGWVIVQEGVYRYRVEQCGTMLVRSVLFEYLATEVYWSEN